MADAINLDYKPKSYFGPRRLEEYLISQVKGAVVRERLETLFNEGLYGEVAVLLGEHGVSNTDLKALGAVHPMFMGGNYLPDMGEEEVEIARIEIASTTFDVTSLYAKPDNGVIRYRVVDEYGGDTLSGPSEMTSEEPLTLGEMTDFFLNAWPLIDVLEMNFDDDIESALGFFKAKSHFYSDFDCLCRQRVIEAFPVQPEDEEEAEENSYR
jgi:hypothetical protein